MPEGVPSYNQPMADRSLVACAQCDLVQRVPELPDGASLRCPRCDAELARARADWPERVLALGLAAALLFAIANAYPMLGLSVVGRSAETTVLGGAQQLWRDGREIVAALVLFTVVIAPAVQIGFALAIALAARRPRLPGWIGPLLRHNPLARTWSMIEVMLLGVLVALIKIAELAHVIPGTALFALGGLVFVLAGMQASFDERDAWARIVWADRENAAAYRSAR
jgi:paraquat-inducible protein A